MRINNKVWEDFKKQSNIMIKGAATGFAGANLLLMIIEFIISSPFEDRINRVLSINILFLVVLGIILLLAFIIEINSLIVRELEECESVFDIESVEFDGNIKLIANSPVSLTHEFTNALNDLYVSIRFKDLGYASFRISYSDYLRLDEKTLVKYQKIKTLFNQDAINILDVSPVA